MADRIQLRRDTLTNWLAADPVLMDGEQVLVATNASKPNLYDSKKIGDGTHKFSELEMLGYDCLQEMGASQQFPMSQAATTTAINTSYAIFSISGTANIVHDYANKKTTFPKGQFFYYNRNGHAGFTDKDVDVDLSSCGIAGNFFYKKSTNSIVVYGWQTTTSSKTDEYYIGYYYTTHLCILGVSPERIIVKDNVKYKYSNYAIFCTSAPIVYNYDDKTITFPNNQCIYYDGKAYAFPQNKIIDVSGINSDFAYNLFYNVSTGEIVKYPWGTNNKLANSVEYYLGYVYYNHLFIFGASQEKIKLINTSNGKAVSHIGFLTSNGYSDTRVTYDKDNNTIRFHPNSYVLTKGRGYAMTNDQTLTIDSSSIAYNIFFNTRSRNFSLYHWQNEWPVLNVDSDELCCVGYFFSGYVHIFGLSDDQVRLKNTTVYFFGDSITAGVGTSGTNCYHQFIAQALDIKALNYGIGSIGFCVTTSSNVCVGNGAEGAGTYKTESGNNTILEVMKAHNDFRYVSIWAGTNDFGASKPINTFKTAVEEALDYALSITPYVVCATPIRRKSPTTNGLGLSLRDYCDVIKVACEERGIPCFDAYNDAGLNPVNSVNNSTFFTDGLHTNGIGQKRMAMGYKHFVATMLNIKV